LYANKLLQSDNASLHTVNRMFDECKAHLKGISNAASDMSYCALVGLRKFDDDEFKPISQDANARCFVRMLMMQFEHGTTAGSPRMKWNEQPQSQQENFSRDVVDWFVKWGASWIWKITETPGANDGDCDVPTNIERRLRSQWNDFIGRRPQSGMRALYQTYTQTLAQLRAADTANKVKDVDELGAVKFFTDTCEERAADAALSTVYCNVEFSIVCRALLAVVPSEASVERSFSAEKLVHTQQRNRLHFSTIDQEMVIKFNRRVFMDDHGDNVAGMIANVIVIHEDDDDVSVGLTEPSEPFVVDESTSMAE
jgi:hypothetical protein